MEMKIRESNGTFKVTLSSLAGQELTVYREMSGGFTFELREAEEEKEVEFMRVPLFKADEREAVAAWEEAVQEKVKEEVGEEAFVKEYARNNTLFHKLSDLRRELATAANVPPYMIFHDKTLWSMVETMPVDLSALGKIGGVGKSKLEKYGGKFLSALKEGV